MEESDKSEKKGYIKKGGNGGARKGAGSKLGAKYKKTIAKEIELAYIKERVSRAKDVLIDSQLSLARGLSYLYRIDKDAKGNDKKPELVTAQCEIEAYLSRETDEDSYYYITTVKPENNAIDSLLDRTVGKPIQKIGGDKDNPLAVIVFDESFKKKYEPEREIKK